MLQVVEIFLFDKCQTLVLLHEYYMMSMLYLQGTREAHLCATMSKTRLVGCLNGVHWPTVIGSCKRNEMAVLWFVQPERELKISRTEKS